MNKKTLAIIIESIPIISAVLAFVLLAIPADTALIRRLIEITFLLAFLGFVVFFVCRKLAKEDKAVRILGILDLLAGVSIIGVYVLAAFLIGL